MKIENFVSIKKTALVRFNVIAFTHAGIGLNELGNFHLPDDLITPKMEALKEALQLSEIMYLSTCNRVEFIFVTENSVDLSFIKTFIQGFNPDWTTEHVTRIAEKARYWNGINAVNHLIEVASSLDSMVLGEREIITQVRNAYNFARDENLCGDTIRIVIRQTIETAKRVYTETSIAEKSVSVVSLAFHELMKHEISTDARVLVVGSGVTNQTLCKFLIKAGFPNFTIFNRTLNHGEKLAKSINGVAYPLTDLNQFEEGFDLILTCTGASHAIITPELYQKLNRDNKPKYIVDLAIPTDTDQQVITENNSLTYISVDTLKVISEKNLTIRKRELLKARQIIFDSLEQFKSIFEMRQIEIKMRAIPEHVKEIRSKAVNEVFSKELDNLDDSSKEVLDKILNYMEKKYVSVPMIMAKEMLTKTN